jgi:hypothetical protein
MYKMYRKVTKTNKLENSMLFYFLFKKVTTAGHQWFMPVILATQETEIRRIMVWSQPGQFWRPHLEHIHHKKGVAEIGDPEFKPQYSKKKVTNYAFISFSLKPCVLCMSMVAHTCNPSTQKAEAGRSQVLGQSGQHGKPCLKNKNTK